MTVSFLFLLIWAEVELVDRSPWNLLYIPILLTSFLFSFCLLCLLTVSSCSVFACHFFLSCFSFCVFFYLFLSCLLSMSLPAVSTSSVSSFCLLLLSLFPLSFSLFLLLSPFLNPLLNNLFIHTSFCLFSSIFSFSVSFYLSPFLSSSLFPLYFVYIHFTLSLLFHYSLISSLFLSMFFLFPYL